MTQPNDSTVPTDDTLVIYFTPDAIRDHFADDPAMREKVQSLSDDVLRKVGAEAQGFDCIWEAFHQALVAALAEINVEAP